MFAHRKHAPLKHVNGKTWRGAVENAGLVDFRWYDLRHAWASWHAQVGTPLHALQELSGWETAAMARRYAHLASEHLAEHAERIARPHLSQTGDDFAMSNELSKIESATEAQ